MRRKAAFWTLTVTLGLAPLGITVAEELHTMHCVSGCPAGRPDNDVVVRHIYTLSNNEETTIADWVAFMVSEDTIASDRSRTWRTDSLLEEEETLEPEDYDGANEALDTDRGHQAPLASLGAIEDVDASTGLAMWQTTNLLSNITAQKSTLNQQPWKNLEAAVRKVAEREDVDSVYVVTGPLFERERPVGVHGRSPQRQR